MELLLPRNQKQRKQKNCYSIGQWWRSFTCHVPLNRYLWEWDWYSGKDVFICTHLLDKIELESAECSITSLKNSDLGSGRSMLPSKRFINRWANKKRKKLKLQTKWCMAYITASLLIHAKEFIFAPFSFDVRVRGYMVYLRFSLISLNSFTKWFS